MRGGSAVAVLALTLGLVGCSDRARSRPADGRLMASWQPDFGTVVVDHGREVSLTLRNVGRSALNLQELWTKGPDRTFLARFEGGPRPLMSGDEVTVRVRFTPRGEGPHSGQLGVLTDSRQEPVFRVQLKGAGVAGAARVPTDLLDFGRIEAESQAELPLVIDNPSGIPVEVFPKVLGADHAELDVGTHFSLAPGERRTVTVSFRPERVGRKQLALAIAPCETCVDEIVPVAGEALEQAVVADPAGVEFGQVPVDRDETRSFSLHNLATVAMQVDRLEVDGSTDASFGVALPPPFLLGPGERRQFVVRYSPGHMGEALGRLSFAVVSRRHPTTDVYLHAFGGAAELCASPVAFDFGSRPIGSRSSVVVNLKSCGASNAPPATLSQISLGPDPAIGGAELFTLAPVALPRTLFAGEEMSVRLFFAPTRSGPAAAQITVESDAYAARNIRLSFTGRGQQHGPCDLAVTPAVVDFGTVQPGAGAVLGIKVENRGQDLCPVSISIPEDGGGAFWLPGGELAGLVVPPGNYFSFMVAFRTVQPGSFSGKVQLGLGGSAERWVPLRGNTQTSCLVATSNYLDFGVARADCPPAPMSTHLENACPSPLVVQGVTIGAGTTDGEFVLTPWTAGWPVTLAPGQALGAEVSYLARVPGMNLSPLYVDVVGLPAPLLVFLLGESDSRLSQTDRFIQQDGNKLDLLLVVDNTASMIEEHPRLRAALPQLVAAANAAGVDLHLGVTTTGIEPASAACPGGAMGGEAGRLFPADGSSPRILTGATPDLAGVLQRNAEVGQCAFVEKGLEAARRALSAPLVDQSDDPRTPLAADGNLGLLRPEAALAVVVIGDEDDHSPDDLDAYVRFLRNLKGSGGPGRATLHAIAPTGTACQTAGGTGNRYGEAARQTGGDVLSVCAADYGPFLGGVAARGAGPQDRFPLSAVPEPASLAVTVDGASTPEFRYDGVRNEVVFSTRPPPAAEVIITYRKSCP